ncbi:hypothetical protein [Knoellia subterranea]|nr:hypothetical protein [Knoellia subterranea]
MTQLVQTRPGHTPTSRSRRGPGRLRLVLATIAVLATLPYVAIKILWLTGSTIGLKDPDALAGSAMEVANAITLLMELTAAALAVALVLEVGKRIPAWLVQIPMFVGTGLLGGILVLLPVEAIRSAVTTPSAKQTAMTEFDPIAGWVYAMVYGGFAVLGVALLTIFALHSWERWIRPGGWTTRLSTWAPVPTRTRVLTMAHAIGLVAICVAELVVATRLELFGSHSIVAVLLSVVAGAGLIALATRTPGSLRGSSALVVTYVGAAAVAAWGLFFFIVMSLPNPLRGDDPIPTTLAILEFLRGLSGFITVIVASRLRKVRSVPGRRMGNLSARPAKGPQTEGHGTATAE